MTDNELLLQDRCDKIKQVIDKYGEDNFYLSFSGGKDSTVLSWLIDYALPDNKIPRVYANTGIELNMIRDFVFSMAKDDKRVVILKPSVPIRQMLEEEGYPFKSKRHSRYMQTFYNSGLNCDTIQTYLCKKPSATGKWQNGARRCPKCLEYQFYEELPFKISHKCCDRLKKDVLRKYEKETGRKYPIIGIMPDEGGQRVTAQCLAFKDNKLKAFQPLVPVTKAWEDWLIEHYDIKICDIYKGPYNFERTGCKGCPFAIDLQHELDILEKYFPVERKQCELIWKPVYEEYRRIGYRLKKSEE